MNVGSDNLPRLSLIAAVIIGGLFVYRWAHPTTVLAADGLDPTWDAAVAQSKGTGQPTVVLFSAGWCGACQSLHRNVLSDSNVQDELYHYNFITIDLTDPSQSVQEHAAKMGVSSIPTMIRYNPDGKETSRTGYLNSSAMVNWLHAGE